MKTISKILIAAFIISGTFLSSCSKYEEGPALSLRTKKGRITNNWKLVKYISNGVDVPLGTTTITIDIKKDDTYSMSYGSYTEVGTWAFSSSKEEVTFTGNASSTADKHTIIKLKGKEFWTKQVDGTDTDEYHYEAN